MNRSVRPLGTPVLILPLAAIGLAVVALPLLALLVNAPWTRLQVVFTDGLVGPALMLSLGTATITTAIAVVIGVPVSWWLTHTTARWAVVVRVLVTLPVVFPPVVGGVALLMAFGRRGLVGSPLERLTGLTLPFTTPAVVLSQVFVAMPFLVLSVEGALRQLDPRPDQAAATLGAGPTRRLFTVTLPQAGSALAAGAALCWARALGEFGATVTFAGNFPGRTQTLPLAIYQALEADPDVAVAMSVLMMLVCLVVLVTLRGRWVSGLLR